MLELCSSSERRQKKARKAAVWPKERPTAQLQQAEAGSAALRSTVADLQSDLAQREAAAQRSGAVSLGIASRCNSKCG